MILLISDLHGRYELVNLQIACAEGRLGRPVEAVVLLGDVGLFEPDLKRFFRRRRERFLRPLYYIEGNHEDHDRLEILANRYADVMTHLPRGTVRTIAGRRFLGLGGTAYMDAHTTRMGSVIGERDIVRCLAHAPDSVDIIITHDCPAGLGLPVKPGFEHLPPPGFPGSEALLRHFRPALWFFGHHHCRYQAAFGGTAYFGLPECSEGFGILADDNAFVFESNPQPPRPSLLSRLRQTFQIRRDPPPAATG